MFIWWICLVVPPKVRTLFRPIATQRPKKGLQYCQTHQNSEELLDWFERCWGRLNMTWGGVSGRQANKAQKWRRRSWGDLGLFAKHFMFLHFGRNFLPNELEYIQIKSDKMLTKQKQQKQKKPTTCHVSGSGLTTLTPPVSLTCFLTYQGHARWGLVVQSIQMPRPDSNFVTLEHTVNSNHSWTAKASLPWPALITNCGPL